MNTTISTNWTRSIDDRVFGGVCGGIARQFGLDPLLVRVLTVVGVLAGFGAVAVVYVVLWVALGEA